MELADLLRQLPRGRITSCGAIARALGDVTAARAVWERVTRNERLPRREALVTESGVFVVSGRRHRDELWEGFEGPRPLQELRQRQEDARRWLRPSVPGPVRTVGAVDVAYSEDHGFAAAVVMDADGRVEIECVTAAVAVDFPYIPGYLTERELPAIRAAYRRLRTPPDVLLVDGQGILHPAGFGLACAVGVALDVPTIGVAKSRLTGDARPLKMKGDLDGIHRGGEQLGWVYASESVDHPLYLSPGDRMDLESCARIIPPLCRTRLPEPMRRADAESKKRKKMKRERVKKTRRN